VIEDPVAGAMRLVARNARFGNHAPNPIRPAPALGASNTSILEEFEVPH
jgi:crotonobetainyl-CoA:carnitine CoA-transferase CaiB-like acyl-CoA transferase